MNKYYPKRVSNEYNDEKILFVGESPGEDELYKGAPFVGRSGELLTNALSRLGLSRKQVSLANLCQFRPVGNKFFNLLGTSVLKEGEDDLKDYILTHQPTLICALGAEPLKFLTGKSGINIWRGSILPCIFAPNIKVVPTYHPSYVLRDGTNYPSFDFDLQKAIRQSSVVGFVYPERRYVLDPQGMEREYAIELLCGQKMLACDIETIKGTTHILCCGFAYSSSDCIVFANHSDSSFYDSVSRVLASSAEKTFHFGTFDVQQLKLNGIRTENYTFDTLVAQHVLNPELPRTLAYLSSVYTDQPYYKKAGRDSIPDDQKGWSEKFDKDALYEYNATDCCETFDIAVQQREEINSDPRLRAIFEFEMEELEMAFHISDSGMLVDEEKRSLFDLALRDRWGTVQTLAQTVIGKVFNVNSPKLKDILYRDLGLPERRKRGKDGIPGSITADEDAIVSLIAFCQGRINELKTEVGRAGWSLKLTILKCILEIRGIRKTLSSYVRPRRSQDGRYRSTVKVANTETGRWSNAKFVDGTGINCQTFPRGFVEIPDDLMYRKDQILEVTIEVEDDLEDDLAEVVESV